MKWKLPHLPWSTIRTVLGVGIIIVAAVTFQQWWPSLSESIDSAIKASRGANSEGEAGHDAGHDAHAGHEDHAPAAAIKSLVLTPQARKNLGLVGDGLKPVELNRYYRTITVPAVVAPRPGRTTLHVSTPLTGAITHVHAVTGETVVTGTLLFEIRLTHEDLVKSQTDFLTTLGELEVERREYTRLKGIAANGVIPEKTLLERQYAVEKLESHLAAEREALRLHGLSSRQVEKIEENRSLLSELQVVAPSVDVHEHDEEDEFRLSGNVAIEPVSFQPAGKTGSDSRTPLVVEELSVLKGESVQAGDPLCILADYSALFIEGHAFEQDAAAITRAVENGWKVTAVFPDESGEQIVGNLTPAFVENRVDPESRTLSFYVNLPNTIVRDTTNAEKQRFITWKFRPGQRLQLEVPVEAWEDQIVLPVDAAVKEGADWFVFQQNGNKFVQVPVHLLHRDQRVVVIANDGSVFPGSVLAQKSAHQIQIAIRNQSGGAVDPHAGHNH